MKNIKSCTQVLPVLLLAFVCTISNAQQTPQQALLALSKAKHSLAIVDPATLKPIAYMPVGEDPHEVVASADGKTAYVTIYGGGSMHELNVFDLVAQKALASVDTRPLFGPHGIVFVNGKVWFSAEGSKAVGRYDPATNKVEWSMGTGEDRTHMLYVTANGKKIYTTNVSSGTVSILDNAPMQPQNFGPPPGAKPNGNAMPPPPGNGPPPNMQQHENWEQTVIPTARGSEGFDVSPDSIELWTASSDDGMISIIDLKAKKLLEKVDAKVNGANRLKFTPNGKLVFITRISSGDVVVFDAKTRKEKKRISIGHGAEGLLMQPDGSRAFVACTPDNYIAVIDLKTLEVTGHIDVGGNPDGLAWATQQ